MSFLKKYFRNSVLSSPPKSLAITKQLMFGTQSIPYIFRVSRLARSISLKISPEKGLEVIVPYRHDSTRVEHFLFEKEAWIMRHLKKIADQKKRGFDLADGSELPVLGVKKIIRLRSLPLTAHAKKAYVKPVQPLLFVGEVARPAPLELHVFSSGNLVSIKKCLEKYFKTDIEKYLSVRVRELSRVMGTTYGTLTVRGQKTRWGSCSAKNNLNFNWRLIFMPLEVTDYVIFHELTHTVHHNHSPKFYAMLEKFCPEYKKLRKILKESPHFF